MCEEKKLNILRIFFPLNNKITLNPRKHELIRPEIFLLLSDHWYGSFFFFKILTLPSTLPLPRPNQGRIVQGRGEIFNFKTLGTDVQCTVNNRWSIFIPKKKEGEQDGGVRPNSTDLIRYDLRARAKAAAGRIPRRVPFLRSTVEKRGGGMVQIRGIDDKFAGGAKRPRGVKRDPLTWDP